MIHLYCEINISHYNVALASTTIIRLLPIRLLHLCDCRLRSGSSRNLLSVVEIEATFLPLVAAGVWDLYL
jgi:hypothetical protein